MAFAILFEYLQNSTHIVPKAVFLMQYILFSCALHIHFLCNMQSFLVRCAEFPEQCTIIFCTIPSIFHVHYNTHYFSCTVQYPVFFMYNTQYYICANTQPNSCEIPSQIHVKYPVFFCTNKSIFYVQYQVIFMCNTQYFSCEILSILSVQTKVFFMCNTQYFSCVIPSIFHVKYSVFYLYKYLSFLCKEQSHAC